MRIVVPFPPGGSADAAARILAEGLAVELKQPVIVENRAGAGTTIAAAHVAASAADGTTLLLTGPISHIVSGALYPRLRYDALRGFVPVSQLTSAPFLIAVPAASPYRSLEELLAAAKASPGRISYGSSGTGASAHLVGEILASEAGANFLHVPYKGAGPATIALIGGEIDFAVSDASAIPHLASGRLRALAVTTARRSALAPGVPSVVEATGLNLDESAGIGILAAAGTPPAAVEALNAAIAKVASHEQFAKRLSSQGMEVAVAPAAQLGASIDAIHRRYVPLVQRLGIKLE
ncbi:MAG TPA: tripartite tricarboxylate transporter substrate binding protein [Ramlibacter sp.]|nr:tripartite tricarboxylate transporter substrate binding protein [Ramlibacter sp.]